MLQKLDPDAVVSGLPARNQEVWGSGLGQTTGEDYFPSFNS